MESWKVIDGGGGESEVEVMGICSKRRLLLIY